MFLLSFTCNFVVSFKRGFLFRLALGIGCVILLWHSLCLPYNYIHTHGKRLGNISCVPRANFGQVIFYNLNMY